MDRHSFEIYINISIQFAYVNAPIVIRPADL